MRSIEFNLSFSHTTFTCLDIVRVDLSYGRSELSETIEHFRLKILKSTLCFRHIPLFENRSGEKCSIIFFDVGMYFYEFLDEHLQLSRTNWTTFACPDTCSCRADYSISPTNKSKFFRILRFSFDVLGLCNRRVKVLQWPLQRKLSLPFTRKNR